MSRLGTDVLRGTLDLMILNTLAQGPLHGWGISQRIQEFSEDALKVGQGSLYPSLQRLEQQGWVKSEWGTTPQNLPAKYYRLTVSGRRALSTERQSWQSYVRSVELVLSFGRAGS